MHTKINRKLGLILALLIALLAGCAASAGNTEEEAAQETATVRTNLSPLESSPAATTTVELSDAGIQIGGDGAEASGSVLTIRAGGVYALRGRLSDGQVVVDAPSDAEVTLLLENADITNTTGAALYEKSCDRLTLLLAEDSENAITGSAESADSEDAPSAALFAEHDLTIGGSGSLVVNAGASNGIGTRDDLVIEGGVLTIVAANHGIRGRDSVSVTGGLLTIDAGGDGIQASNDENAEKGWITLSGGSFAITAENDGIQAETTLTIAGGEYTILSGGGHAAEAPAGEDGGSHKGLKAGSRIDIHGGVFAIDSRDDALHSNLDMAISGGEFTLASGDDGIHASGDLTISSGKIEITACYEGLEASTMTLAGGEISLTSTDDGINIAGGQDENDGQDSFASSGGGWLLISGGSITVVAGRDAIDINGSGEMTGGSVSLTAATQGEGETLDVDGSWSQSGGDLRESGGGGMGGKNGRR